MRKLITATLLASALSAGAASQSTETEATLRAYAAGYKAAFTCSGLFNAGKTLAQIKAHELTGIYPNIQPVLDGLPGAVIDYDKKIVSVKYSEDMPPRISKFELQAGCYQLPPATSLKSAQTATPYQSVIINHVSLTTEANRSQRQEQANNYPWKKIDGSPTSSLHDLLKKAMTHKSYGKDAVTSALLIATPKTLLQERYTEGFGIHTSQRTWSVAKSIAATLVGLGVHQGYVKTDAPTGISAWQHMLDPRKSITLDHVMRMASGLDSNRAGNRTDRLYMGGGRVIDTAVTASLEAEPGKRWKYANNDTLLATRALREALERTYPPNAEALDGEGHLHMSRQFFTRLGMNNTVTETDWDGNQILSSQVWTTARDLARLGILYLQDGVWEGERLLPEGWVEYVSSPLGPQPPALRRNGEPNPGYGAQWWLYNERFQEKYPGIPTDTFAARGNRGQFLVVIPSKNIVIVRRGYDPAGGEGFKLAKFIEDVVAALE